MRVDFYLLSDPEPAAWLRFAARLLGKIVDLKLPALVLCTTEAERETLSALLWSLEPDSFLAHAAIESAIPAPIRLAVGASAASADIGCVVNLRAQPQPVTDQVERVAEVVAADESAKAAARERFRRYRAAGAELHTHAR